MGGSEKYNKDYFLRYVRTWIKIVCRFMTTWFTLCNSFSPVECLLHRNIGMLQIWLYETFHIFFEMHLDSFKCMSHLPDLCCSKLRMGEKKLCLSENGAD